MIMGEDYPKRKCICCNMGYQSNKWYSYDTRKCYKIIKRWILIKTNADDTEIAEIIVRKKEEKHIETCEW